MKINRVNLQSFLLVFYLLQTPFDNGGTEPYHMAISTFIILCFWLIEFSYRRSLPNKIIFQLSIIFLFIFLFFFFMGISILSSVDKSVSVWLYMQWLNHILFILAMIIHFKNSDVYLSIIDRIIVPFAGIMSVWGLYHLFYGNSVYLREGNHFRALAMFDNPNSLSAYLGMVLIIISVQFINEIVRKNKIIIYALFLLVSVGFIAAQSRAGLISLIVAMGAYLIIMGWKNIQKILLDLLYLLLGFSAMFSIISFFNSAVIQRMQSIVGPERLPIGIKDRLDLWTSAWEIATENFFFGTGIGTFYLMLPSKSSIVWSNVQSMAHSDYMQFLSEIGFAGTIFFILALIVYLWIGFELVRKIKKSEEFISAKNNMIISIYAASIIPIVHSIVDYDLRTPGVFALFLFLASFIWREANKAGLISGYSKEFKIGRQLQNIMKTIGFLLIIVIIGFISLTVLSDYYYKIALKNEEEKNYLSGVEYADKAISLRGTISNYHNFMARNYFRLGIMMKDSSTRRDVLLESEKEFLTAMNLSPMITHNYIGLASLYQSNGDLFESVERKVVYLYEKAIKTNKASSSLRFDFAEILMKVGRFDMAVKSLEPTIGRVLTMKMAQTLLAEAYRLSGEPVKAKKTIDSRLEEDPVNGFANFIKGNVLVDLGNLDEAVTYYLKALDDSRGDNRIEVLKQLALTYFNSGEIEYANDYVGEILNERPNENIPPELLNIIQSIKVGDN